MAEQSLMGETLTFRYRFHFSDGREGLFEVELDRDTLELKQPEREIYPDWTRLDFHQCPNCPLNVATHPRCPVAQSLVDLVDFFKDFDSFDQVEVAVEAKERTYSKKTSMQEAVGPLIGLHMTTTGCPILNKLRPMVLTHLPFMSTDESTYRMITMYLLAQYFLYKRGGTPDWDLKKMLDFFADIQQVNTSFCKRLQSIPAGDASINAVVMLNSMSDVTSLRLEMNDLTWLERIFSRHYPQESPPTSR